MTQTPRFALAAVSAPDARAAAIGRDALAQGGSALEAMVAAAAALAVTMPHRAGLGADACWLIREPGGRTHVIDALGVAGASATGDLWRKAGHHETPMRGAMAAATVPGAVAGWARALEAARAFGGRLPLADLLAPAIKLARDGFAQTSSAARAPADLASLAEAPNFAAAFLRDGKLPEAGALLKAGKLADTLEQIAHAGLRDFYRGDVSREMASDMERMKLPLLRADLEKYETRVRRPLSLRIGRRTYFAAPSPTQGLALLVALGLHARLGGRARDDFASLHTLAESVKRALRIAQPFALDPAMVDGEPASWLTPLVLERESMALSRERAAPSPLTPVRQDCVFFGAVDPTGLAAACVTTMGAAYGSGCVSPHTGVLFNNRAAFFSLDPRAPQALAPGREPPHAPSPALCVEDDGRVTAFGSGDPQIDAQLAARMAEGMGLSEAIEASRFLAGWKNALRLEDRFDPSVVRTLEKAGHDAAIEAAQAEDFAPAGALMRDRRGVEAAHDPRTEGAADGL